MKLSNVVRAALAIGAFMLCSITVQAQSYVVYAITGDVQLIKKGVASPLKLRQVLSKYNTLNIPYDASCEIIDASSNKKYDLQVSGRGMLKDMLRDKRNSVVELTKQYLSYIKSQISGSGQTTTIRCSDPATIKRFQEELDSVAVDSIADESITQQDTIDNQL